MTYFSSPGKKAHRLWSHKQALLNKIFPYNNEFQKNAWLVSTVRIWVLWLLSEQLSMFLMQFRLQFRMQPPSSSISQPAMSIAGLRTMSFQSRLAMASMKLWLPIMLLISFGSSQAHDGWNELITDLAELDGPTFRDRVAYPLVELSANAYRYPNVIDVPGWILSSKVAPVAPAEGGMHALVYEVWQKITLLHLLGPL